MQAIQVNQGKNNIFMIFGMLLIGVFSITIFTVIDIFFTTGFLKHMMNFANIIHLSSKSLAIVIPIIILILYSIGFITYLLSLVLISNIPWIIIQNVYTKDKHIFSEGIVDELFSQDLKYKKFLKSSLLFKRSILYITLLNENKSFSSDLKFAYAQLLFAKSILFILTISIIITLYLKFTLATTIISGILVFIIANCLYAYGLKLFDDLLAASYLSKEINEFQTFRKRKNNFLKLKN